MSGISKLAALVGLFGSMAACNALFGIGDGFVGAEATPDGSTDAKVEERDAEGDVADVGLPVPSHLSEGSTSYRWDSTFSLTGSRTLRVENEKLLVLDENNDKLPVPDEWWTWNRGCSCLVLSLDRFETSGATDAGGPQTVTIRQDAPLIIVARTVILNGILSVSADLLDASTPLSASDGKPASDGGLGGGGGGGGLAEGGSGGNGGSGSAGGGGARRPPSPFTIFTPLSVGARGASGGRGCVGGAGGGALQISAASMVVRGTVVASGAGGALCAAGGGGGGGAGGMLWFEVATGSMVFSGANFGANGGGGAAGATLDGGAGGAGQTATSTLQASGGTNDAGAARAGNGGNGGVIRPDARIGLGGPGLSSAASGGGGGGSVGFVLHRGEFKNDPAPFSSPPLTTVGP